MPFPAQARRSCHVKTALSLVVCICARSAGAAVQSNQLATFSYSAKTFLLSPSGNTLYAASPSTNQIAVFDVVGLSQTATIALPTSAAPGRMIFSPDGSTLYATEPGLNSVVAISTATDQVTNTFHFSDAPLDLAFTGTDRLYVLHGPSNGSQFNSLTPISATTGAADGTSYSYDLPNNGTLYGGSLGVTADRNSLYYSNTGVSSSGVYKCTVTSGGALQVQASFHSTEPGSAPLTVSHNGQLVNAPCLTDLYQLNATTLASSGLYLTPYPFSTAQNSPLAFAYDDSVTYISAANNNAPYLSTIESFSNATLAQGPSISIVDGSTPLSLIADGTGKQLWAAQSNGILAVYSVPEPVSAVCILIATGMFMARRSNRMK